MENSVIVSGLVKSYGNVRALDSVSFEVGKGEIFGFIGPDGTGKTTLFRVLATLLKADSGTAVVEGLDVVKDYRAIRRQVGYMPGHFSLYADLTVEENLRFFATVFNTTVKENYGLIKDIYSRLEPFAKRKAGALSGGMKQKLALSCALIHKPSVLFLDEPTTGVDPVSRKEFWQMLRRLNEQDITILVSTPYMDEAVLCDRIALAREGRFLEIDTPQGIIGRFDKALWAMRSGNMFRLLTDLRSNNMVDSCYAFGNVHHVTIIGAKGSEVQEQENINNLKGWLEERGHQEVEIYPIVPGIEDCYMRKTKGGSSLVCI